MEKNKLVKPLVPCPLGVKSTIMNQFRERHAWKTLVIDLGKCVGTGRGRGQTSSLMVIGSPAGRGDRGDAGDGAGVSAIGVIKAACSLPSSFLVSARAPSKGLPLTPLVGPKGRGEDGHRVLFQRSVLISSAQVRFTITGRGGGDNGSCGFISKDGRFSGGAPTRGQRLVTLMANLQKAHGDKGRATRGSETTEPVTNCGHRDACAYSGPRRGRKQKKRLSKRKVQPTQIRI